MASWVGNRRVNCHFLNQTQSWTSLVSSIISAAAASLASSGHSIMQSNCFVCRVCGGAWSLKLLEHNIMTQTIDVPAWVTSTIAWLNCSVILDMRRHFCSTVQLGWRHSQSLSSSNKFWQRIVDRPTCDCQINFSSVVQMDIYILFQDGPFEVNVKQISTVNDLQTFASLRWYCFYQLMKSRHLSTTQFNPVAVCMIKTTKNTV